jgi:hypothetical protein
MTGFVSALTAAAFLALVSERIVAGLITPIFEKFNLDKFYLLYVAWIIGGVLVYLSGANLFSEYIPNPLIGQVLTAVVAGGGANLLHDLFDRQEITSVLGVLEERVDAG